MSQHDGRDDGSLAMIWGQPDRFCEHDTFEVDEYGNERCDACGVTAR